MIFVLNSFMRQLFHTTNLVVDEHIKFISHYVYSVCINEERYTEKLKRRQYANEIHWHPSVREILQ